MSGETTMTIPGTLHHIEIYVRSLPVSQRFWQPFLTQLGYAEFQKWETGISYILQDTYLVFVQAESDYLDAGYHRKRVGLNHLAFHAASRDQVDVLTEWVITSGFTLLYPDRHPYAGGQDYYALFCEDPDRIKVEVVVTP